MALGWGLAMNPSYWAFGAYVFLILAICGLMLGVSYFVGGRTRGRAKNDPFESGIVSTGGAHLRLSAKFYLVAMFFVIFDVEALFLYAWAVSVKESGWTGFVEAAIFIAILTAGLFYLCRIRALDWAPQSRRRRQLQSEESRS